MALGEEDIAGCAPAALDCFAGLDELGLGRHCADVTSEEFKGDRFGTRAGVCGFPPQGCSVDAVGLVGPRLTTHRALSGICSDTLLAELTGKFAAPFAQRRLANVQP